MCKQKPDTDLIAQGNTFSSDEDQEFIIKHRPHRTSRSMFISLDKIGQEPNILASNEFNPELLLMAKEATGQEPTGGSSTIILLQEQFGDLDTLYKRDADAAPEITLSPPEAPVPKLDNLPKCMGMSPRGRATLKK